MWVYTDIDLINPDKFDSLPLRFPNGTIKLTTSRIFTKYDSMFGAGYMILSHCHGQPCDKWYELIWDILSVHRRVHAHMLSWSISTYCFLGVATQLVWVEQDIQGMVFFRGGGWSHCSYSPKELSLANFPSFKWYMIYIYYINYICIISCNLSWRSYIIPWPMAIQRLSLLGFWCTAPSSWRTTSVEEWRKNAV